MNRTLFSGLVAVALAGAAFGQADKSKTPKTKDDTNFQKGDKDPTALPKPKKQDQKKTGKSPEKQPAKQDKSGTKTGPTDPHETPVPYGPNAPIVKR